MSQNRVRRIKIDKTAAGRRLDQWLAEQCAPELSRARLARLIGSGQVQVNGAPVMEPRFRPPVGGEVLLNLPPPAAARPAGEAIELAILYEDADIIVVNKPAGLVVHPGSGNSSGTLVNALIHHCAQHEAAGFGLSGIGGVKRPGIVHRLDKDTSGVMVAAKNDAAHNDLSRQFADHGRTGALERRYQALLWGVPVPAAGVIAVPLARDRHDRTRRAVARASAGDAREAITHYAVLQNLAAGGAAPAVAALVECRLETGRTHQIRVHMAYIGHPLIGDKTYGQAFKTKANRLPEAVRPFVAAFPRQALHAAYLQIKHPKTGAVMRFSAELPPDMQALLRALRGQSLEESLPQNAANRDQAPAGRRR